MLIKQVSVVISVVALVIMFLFVVTIIDPLVGPPETKIHRAEFQVRTMKIALELLKIDIGRYPSESEGLKLLLAEFGREIKGYKQGGYIDSLPIDPWGSEYQYKFIDSNSIEVFSYGKDGKISGNDIY